MLRIEWRKFWRRTSAGMALTAVLLQASAAHPGGKPEKARAGEVPGVVIDHGPASSGLYVGSPSLAVLTNGNYVAAHDWFGPKSKEHELATTVVFRSSDRGNTWKKVSQVSGAFWSSLFVHRGALYLLGPERHHGSIYIRRSTDGGESWTSVTNSRSGLLRGDGQYHCAPTPVIEHEGRLWRAFERREPPTGWGTNYRAGMMSVSAEADLLEAGNWTSSNYLPSERWWNGGDMGGWLEGNAVVTRDGRMLDVLRVESRDCPERAAIVSISADGRRASFDPATGFITFPGGAKKFTIRYDEKSECYWSLATVAQKGQGRAERPGGIRNTLALTCSKNLRKWSTRCILLYHPDVRKHGFQYVDWLFEGEDLIAVCRTAYDDEEGGAHNNHDANFLTFHRIKDFRKLSMADSALMSEVPGKRSSTGIQ